MRVCRRGAVDEAVSTMENDETKRSGLDKARLYGKSLRCAALKRTKPMTRRLFDTDGAVCECVFRKLVKSG